MKYDREVSCLIPYRIRDGIVEVFVQRRSEKAKRAPGKFGFFGGHLEAGETPEQALIREMREELSINLSEFPYLWLSEFPFERDGEQINKYVWYLKTEPDFESKIKIAEDESGHWFAPKDFLQLENRLKHDSEVLEVFIKKIS